jgi:hypothetical protein
VQEDYLHEEMKFKSGSRMQLDVFLPELGLAFEYQGQQHFFDVYTLGQQWRYLERDEDKRLACKEKGITLIEVPFWWDFKKESLIATIHKVRPELISSPGSGTPIPTEMPEDIRSGIL